MEEFTLYVDKKVDLIKSIKNNEKNVTFSKGSYVTLKNSNDIFKIINIVFPTATNKIVLLENTKNKKRFWVDPSNLL
ncbi:hypothetical protein K9M42_03295 [Patescibacteria group bacterium]|nr:hypothetical protein [Patescibacteria group bacterium]